MYKLVLLLMVGIGVSCNININLNFDPEKLERAMDSFLDDIGYGKKDKKQPTFRLFSFVDILILAQNIYTHEDESPLEKIKKEMKKNHQSLEKYYNNHIKGEALDGTIKIKNEKKVKDEKELKELRSLIEKQNSLRENFFKEFAKSNGKDTQEAVEQVKEVFIRKTIERAKENNWCIEEEDENNKVKWQCE